MIDPSRSIDPYLDAAAAEGLRIVGSAETHIHADFVSGSRELVDRVGAKLYLSDEGPAEWKYRFADGVLSGLFGVGGGFVIVPALVLFSGMAIHYAVGTSLLVITLVSISGIASHLFAGRTISMVTTALFVVGGVAGLFLGNLAGRRLSSPALQKVFALAIVAVAMFVIVRTVFQPSN